MKQRITLEILELLEKAKQLYEKTTKTQDIEIKKKIYPLLIETLDLSAEYREKHEKLKEYVKLLYTEEKEKQATYLKDVLYILSDLEVSP